MQVSDNREKVKVPDKSSQRKALDQLNQSQLIEVICTLQANEKRLAEEIKSLRKLLSQKEAMIAASQNTSEETASASEIVEQAKLAAKKYLESVRDMGEKAKQANTQVVDAAEKRASEILDDAEFQAQFILDKAKLQAQKILSKTYSSLDDLDTALSQSPDALESSEEDDILKSRAYLDPINKDLAYTDKPKLPLEAQFIEELSSVMDEDYDNWDDELDGLDSGDYSELEQAAEPILAPTVVINIGEEQFWDDEDVNSLEEADASENGGTSFSKASKTADNMEKFSTSYDPIDAFRETLSDFYDQLDDIDSALEDAAAIPDLQKEETSSSAIPESDGSPRADFATPDDTDFVAPGDTDFASDEASKTIDLSKSGALENEASATIDSANEGSASGDSSVDETVESDNRDVNEDNSNIPSYMANSEVEAFEPLDPTISGLLSMTKEQRKAAKKAKKASKKILKAARRSGNPRLEKMNAKTNPENSNPSSETSQSEKLSSVTSTSENLHTEEKDVSADKTGDTSSDAVISSSISANKPLNVEAVPEIMKASYDNFISANSSQEAMQEAINDDFDYEMCFDDADVYKE